MISYIQQLKRRYDSIIQHAALDADQQSEMQSRLNALRLAEAVLGKLELNQEQPGHPLQIGILGPTQAGKSTLVKLLLRFYDASAGQVTVAGKDIRSLSLKSLRQHIGFVSQDTFLFHGTVRENIAYGKPEATLAELICARGQHRFVPATGR